VRVPQCARRAGPRALLRARRVSMSPNMFGRPDDPISETPTTISSPNAPNVSVAYPTFNDWLGLYDFHKTLNGGDAAKRVLFNDMKRGHEHTVLELLNLVSKQSTGRSVLAEIMLAPTREVRILPFDFMASSSWSFHVGAETSPWILQNAWLKDAPIAGAGATGERFAIEDGKTGRLEVGRGTGSGSDIFFSANRYRGAKQADETLLHELVHASRMARGVQYHMPVNGGYGDLEEFLAVTVANMYRAQLRRPLRDYQFREIKAADFLNSNLSPTAGLLLAYMRNKQKSLFERLAALDDAPFNPMKQVKETSDALIRKIEHA
jgi:hypothetical protein